MTSKYITNPFTTNECLIETNHIRIRSYIKESGYNLTLNTSLMNQRSQRDDSRIQKERNKANDFMFKLQYDVSIFSNRRQSNFTKCSLMISQREIMISQLPSNFSVFLISRSVDVLDLKVDIFVLKNKGIMLANI